jgi:NAD(P)-dependent dehydrogenase (short-subunit alcohol dehydrogenase family)
VAVADINERGALATIISCKAALPKVAASAECISIAVDLATAEGPESMVDQAVAHFERLDVVINCAACAPVESFLDMTSKSWEGALFINVRAVALTMSAAGRVMVRQRSGHIVNVTSAAARMAIPSMAAYASSKAAVDALTRAGAAALGPHGVRVNSLSPGMMDTPMQERIEAGLATLERRSDISAFKTERTERIPMKRRTSPEEMAKTLVWLAIDSPPYMTAGRVNVSGGLDKD